jgi:hypothetical protein
MSGILFTDGNLVLGGYSSKKQKITGIGGKSEKNEIRWQTAIRETIEELYEFTDLNWDLLNSLSRKLSFDTVVSSGSYTTFIMSFEDLEVIIKEVFNWSLISKVYPVLPKNIMELIFSRIHDENINVELSRLVLIPCKSKFQVSKCFLNDIETFNNTM